MALSSVESNPLRWGIDASLVDLDGVAAGGAYPKAAVFSFGHFETTLSLLVPTPIFCDIAYLIRSHRAKLQEIV